MEHFQKYGTRVHVIFILIIHKVLKDNKNCVGPFLMRHVVITFLSKKRGEMLV